MCCILLHQKGWEETGVGSSHGGRFRMIVKRWGLPSFYQLKNWLKMEQSTLLVLQYAKVNWNHR
jgi:hypothetical protein